MSNTRHCNDPEMVMLRARCYKNVQRKNSSTVIAENDNKRVLCLTMLMSIGKKSALKYKRYASDYKHFILVTMRISFQAMAILKECFNIFELLRPKEIYYNKTLHVMVPKYKILSAEEVDEIQIQYGPIKHFPKIIANVDPIARYLNFREGQVVSIDKPGRVTYYRHVVSLP